MSFADPTVTLSGSAITLPRTGMGMGTGAFTAPDGTLTLTVAHSYGRRTRRTLQLAQTKVSADPLVPANSVRSNMRAYLVVDTPVNGYTVAEAKAVVDALTGFLTVSSGARISQLLGGEA